MQNNQPSCDQDLPLDVRSDFADAAPPPIQKARRIVTWTQEEDVILREQISIHGTENWTLIASKLNDKTTRQCRRRWYTYLNTDFKKGGWSVEEDILLCEAQKIFGNRWTEIAKVVSGRTDNAVKNRFSTLCKKQAKCESSAKHKNSYAVSDNKRVIVDGDMHSEGTSASLIKKRRPCIHDIIKVCDKGDPLEENRATTRQHPRSSVAVLAQDVYDVNKSLLPQLQYGSDRLMVDGDDEKTKAPFLLKKDDPKIAAFMRQAELLSSLALKVNEDYTEQSLETAWKVLQNFHDKIKENGLEMHEASDMDLQIDDVKSFKEDIIYGTLYDLKDLATDFQISDEVTQPLQRNPDFHVSPNSSEYSTGSTVLCATPDEPMQQNQSAICTQKDDTRPGLRHTEAVDEQGDDMTKSEFLPGVISSEVKNLVPPDMEDNGDIAALSTTEFDSPLHVTPLFRSLAAGTPSPQFSESERRFLMRTLGIQSPAPSTSADPSQPPHCRRALVNSL